LDRAGDCPADGAGWTFLSAARAFAESPIVKIQAMHNAPDRMCRTTLSLLLPFVIPTIFPPNFIFDELLSEQPPIF
jgi:hypothetical protein